MPFRTSTDIANRALQVIGATRIGLDGVSTLFTEVSKNAEEIAACYHDLRVAELRRNVWTFSCRKTVLRPTGVGTMLLVAPLYNAALIYSVGSIVKDSNGFIYISRLNANIANTPSSSPQSWAQYFGPNTVNAWAASNNYWAGELVYVGSYPTIKVYLSLLTGNADNPSSVPGAWSATTTYKTGDTVVQSAATYVSTVDLNINITPVATAAAWVATTTYGTGNQVLGSNNHQYTSVTNANTGNDPTLDTTGTNWTDNGKIAWVTPPSTATNPDQMQGQNWLQLSNATLQAPIFIYPVQSGPAEQMGTRNVYQLPNNYLREAPQDPKAGSQSYLGAPSGRQYDDWVFENDYIITTEVNPIIFRFAADVADVTTYDPMFCEGLAGRIGMEICEVLTQSTEKLEACVKLYDGKMDEARTVNGIEQQPTEPPMDDWISCRV